MIQCDHDEVLNLFIGKKKKKVIMEFLGYCPSKQEINNSKTKQ